MNALPAVMEVDELVDAALAGFDRRETVMIPPLPDEAQWTAFEAARQAMIPNFSQGPRRSPLPRRRLRRGAASDTFRSLRAAPNRRKLNHR